MEPSVLLEITKEMRDSIWEKGVRAYFAACRVYNPAITAWCMSGRTILDTKNYFTLQTNYWFGLSYYTKGIIKKDFDEIIQGLKLINEVSIFFKQFIFFDSIFKDTLFLVNPNGRIKISVKSNQLSQELVLTVPDDPPVDFNSVKTFPVVDDNSINLQINPSQDNEDIVGAIILPKECISDTKLMILHESSFGKRPRDKLNELFDYREDVPTKQIGCLGFKNPFAQILTGEAYESDFNNALECLHNEEFNLKWRLLKKRRPQIPQERGSKETSAASVPEAPSATTGGASGKNELDMNVKPERIEDKEWIIYAVKDKPDGWLWVEKKPYYRVYQVFYGKRKRGMPREEGRSENITVTTIRTHHSTKKMSQKVRLGNHKIKELKKYAAISKEYQAELALKVNNDQYSEIWKKYTFSITKAEKHFKSHIEKQSQKLAQE
jgi:hypothetical protein